MNQLPKITATDFVQSFEGEAGDEDDRRHESPARAVPAKTREAKRCPEQVHDAQPDVHVCQDRMLDVTQGEVVVRWKRAGNEMRDVVLEPPCHEDEDDPEEHRDREPDESHSARAQP